MKTEKKHSLSTYACILMSSSESLSEVIRRHTRSEEISTNTPPSDTSSETATSPPPSLEAMDEIPPSDTSSEAATPSLLSLEEMDEILLGPYAAFVKQQCKVYGTLAKVRLAASTADEAAFKEARAMSKAKETTASIPKTVLEQASLSSLDTLQKELDALTLQQNEEWEKHYTAWVQQLITWLEKEDIALTRSEVEEMQRYEPITILKNHYAELGISLPKLKNKEMFFSDYMKLRSRLVIINALSRQHEPHEEADLKKIFKNAKSIFDTIQLEEKTLFESQVVASDELVRALRS